MIRRPTWRAAATVPPEAAEPAEALFADSFPAVANSEDGPHRLIEGFGPSPPDRGLLEAGLMLLGLSASALVIEEVPPTDWLAATAQAFPPITIGRFVIHGSHERPRLPPPLIGLEIDAATAFGTGEHPTTAGCLTALQRFASRPRRILDLGCGTGILALAAARLWPAAAVLAADNDPEAVRVAAHVFRRNHARVRATVSDGFANPLLHRRFDLILANILARPLARLAPDIARRLAPGGTAVLAGLLAHQERIVVGACLGQGLALRGRIRHAVWPTLIVARPFSSLGAPGGYR